jgi:hypothetical protein
MDATTRNMLAYLVIGTAWTVCVALGVSIANGEVPWLQDPGRTWLKSILIAVLAFLAPAFGLLATAYRSRVGSEPLAAQVDRLRERGFSRQDMTVVPTGFEDVTEPRMTREQHADLLRLIRERGIERSIVKLAEDPPTAWTDPVGVPRVRYVDPRRDPPSHG